jgi:hypothetical protein
MDKNALLNELIIFLKSEEACKQTITCLSPNAEITIKVADIYELSIKSSGGEVLVEEKKASNPEFIFKATPIAIETLISEKGLSPASLGIKLLKQIINGDIKVSMPSNLFQVSKQGYLNILKVGGMDFLNELKKHGLTNVPKILSALKKLKKS